MRKGVVQKANEFEIGFYVAECARSNWNVRELRRQMGSVWLVEDRQ